MSTLPRQQSGILITVGLAVVAAAVAGAVLFTSGKASEVDLTTAKLVPDDAGVYVALNTDLTSSQWVAAFNLMERLGVDDPMQLLRDGAEEGGVDWDDDVVPFLGGNAAVYLKGFDIESFSVQGAVIVRCKDPKRAMDVVMQQAGVDFEKERYEGTDYFSGQGLLVARLDDHIVVALDIASMEEVIDTAHGKHASLAGVADFKSLRDELTNNFLAFVYMDAEALSDSFLGEVQELKDALEQSGAGELALKPGAAVLGAKSEGFEFQAASVGDPGQVSPMLEARTPRFASMVPADAAIFVSTKNIAQTWKEIRARSQADLDTLAQQEGYRNLDDALESAGAEIGLKNVEELVDLFTGETSLAAWFTSTNQDDAEVVLIAEVENEGNARSVLESVAGSGTFTNRRTESVNGVEMKFLTDEDGQELGYAVRDGSLVFGTAKAARAIIAKDFGPNLADSANYKKTVKQMPTALGTFGYFDLATLLRLTAGGVPVNLDEAEQALEGAILNIVEQRGVARLSGVVTIAGK